MITTGNETTDEAEISLPTVEEFWAVIEAGLSEAPEIQRPTPIGLTSTSRKLARNWKAILDDSSESQTSKDHYLSEAHAFSAPPEIDHIEPDLVIALAGFLVGRLTERLHEVRQVQLQLQHELARFSSE